MRDYIFGEHVANYMRELSEESPEKYQKLFSEYVKQGLSADDLEDMYANAHKAIREDPNRKKAKSDKEGERKKREFVLKKIGEDEWEIQQELANDERWDYKKGAAVKRKKRKRKK